MPPEYTVFGSINTTGLATLDNIASVGGRADLIQIGHQVCDALSPSVSPAMVTGRAGRWDKRITKTS